MICTITLNTRTIEYELQRKNVKNVNLRIRSDGSVYVSAHKSIPLSFIEDFIKSRSDFILSAIDRCEERKRNAPKESEYNNGDTICILGKERVLLVNEGNRNNVAFINGTGSVLLTVKNTSDTALKKKTVEKWQKELCRDLITELCHRTYPLFVCRGIPFPELHFHAMRTRWGSCNSHGGSLNFNTALIHKPVRCIEYVVMHEFVHFIHPDHSSAFYAELASLMPDWKERKKELEKNYCTL